MAKIKKKRKSVGVNKRHGNNAACSDMQVRNGTYAQLAKYHREIVNNNGGSIGAKRREKAKIKREMA